MGASLVDRLAEAIAAYEGWNITEEQARRMGVRWPPLCRRLANPGNIRRWRDAAGNEYPRTRGYVDLIAWAQARMPGASEQQVREAAEREGWRILRAQLSRYLSGKTLGKRPTLRELITAWAPPADGNDTEAYLNYVSRRLGIEPDAELAA